MTDYEKNFRTLRTTVDQLKAASVGDQTSPMDSLIALVQKCEPPNTAQWMLLNDLSNVLMAQIERVVTAGDRNQQEAQIGKARTVLLQHFTRCLVPLVPDLNSEHVKNWVQQAINLAVAPIEKKFEEERKALETRFQELMTTLGTRSTDGTTRKQGCDDDIREFARLLLGIVENKSFPQIPEGIQEILCNWTTTFKLHRLIQTKIHRCFDNKVKDSGPFEIMKKWSYVVDFVKKPEGFSGDPETLNAALQGYVGPLILTNHFLLTENVEISCDDLLMYFRNILGRSARCCFVESRVATMLKEKRNKASLPEADAAVECYHCRQLGHYANACPARDSGGVTPQSPPSRGGRGFGGRGAARGVSTPSKRGREDDVLNSFGVNDQTR